MSGDRLKGLDGIRGIAVLLVVIYHICEFLGPNWSHLQNITKTWNFGVDIFFVLSGFLITWLFIKEERSYRGISLKNFYVRRTIRILPAALTFLSVIALLKIVNFSNYEINTPWSGFISAALFVKNYHPLSGNEVGHFWSLAIEEHFYITLPSVFILSKKTKNRIFLLSTLALIAPFWKHFNLAYFGAEFVNWKRSDIRMEPMLYGCLLALIRDTDGLQIIKSKTFNRLPIFSVCIIYIVLSYAIRSELPGYVNALTPSIRFLSVAIIINILIETDSKTLNQIFSSRILVFFGSISYSLYLWQQYFCYSLPRTWDKSLPFNFILAVIFACGSYYLIEKPILRYRIHKGLGTRKRDREPPQRIHHQH